MPMHDFVFQWNVNEFSDSDVLKRLAPVRSCFAPIRAELRRVEFKDQLTSTIADSNQPAVHEGHFQVVARRGYIADFIRTVRDLTNALALMPDWRRSDSRSTRELVAQPFSRLLKQSRASAELLDHKNRSVWELTNARLQPGKNGKCRSEFIFYSNDRKEMQQVARDLGDHVYKQMHRRWRIWGPKDALSIGVSEYLENADRKGFVVRLEHASSLSLIEAAGYALLYMKRPSVHKIWRGELDALDRGVVRYSRLDSKLGSAAPGQSRAATQSRRKDGRRRGRSVSQETAPDKRSNHGKRTDSEASLEYRAATAKPARRFWQRMGFGRHRGALPSSYYSYSDATVSSSNSATRGARKPERQHQIASKSPTSSSEDFGMATVPAITGYPPTFYPEMNTPTTRRTGVGSQITDTDAKWRTPSPSTRNPSPATSDRGAHRERARNASPRTTQQESLPTAQPAARPHSTLRQLQAAGTDEERTAEANLERRRRKEQALAQSQVYY